MAIRLLSWISRVRPRALKLELVKWEVKAQIEEVEMRVVEVLQEIF